MTYKEDLHSYTFVSLDKDFKITRERKREDNQYSSRFLIESPAIRLKILTNWYLDQHITNMIQLLMAKAPEMKGHLPLIETTNFEHGSVCSSYLLKDGELFHCYLPEQDTLAELKELIVRHDSEWMADGNKYRYVKYNEIAAILIE